MYLCTKHNRFLISKKTIQVEVCKTFALKIAQRIVALFTKNYPSLALLHCTHFYFFQDGKLRNLKDFPSLQIHRFPIRTIRQTRFGVLSTCKRNWDLRRSRSLSHIDLEDRHIFQARTRCIGTGSREEDFDLLIVRPKEISAPKKVENSSKKSILKKSKSMVEILGNHEGVIFLSEC